MNKSLGVTRQNRDFEETRDFVGLLHQFFIVKRKVYYLRLLKT